MERLGEADPRSVGGYPLFARLGAGGMGQVYLSRSPAGRALALKTVRGEFGADPGFGERFAREIRHADRVRSPWTVAVVDFSQAGAHPQWLATEYVAAPSLADWVAAHGPLPAESLTALAAELCEALHAVHQAGLAHRDVKPSNVLLGRARPLLIDFGIARAAEDSRHTRTGGVIGSPGYMAPEQATAGVSAEPGDVFALGAVLVYAATGHGPFNRPGEEPSTPALLYRVVYEEPDLTGLPPVVTALVRACLDKDPRARPTARGAAALLGTPGSWPAQPPPGLVDELLGREAEMRAALGQPAAAEAAAPVTAPPLTALGTPVTSPAQGATPPLTTPAPGTPLTSSAAGAAPLTSPVPSASLTSSAPGTAPLTAPAAGTAAHGLGPSPYAPRGLTPLPAQATRPAPVQWNRGAPGTPAPRGAAYSGVPGLAPSAARPSHTGRIAVIGVGVAVLLILTGVYVHQRRISGSGDGVDTPTASPSATSPAALPASWVGTWTGDGPGNPSGSGVGEPRTDKFTVTLTLRSGTRGSVVGEQVSDVREIGTGRNVGCTEALRLSDVRTGSMVFEAVTSQPTDLSYGGVCAKGNVYVVTMTDARTLRLDDGGAQSIGSPATFTKTG